MLKYALIGCGRISPNHIEAAKSHNSTLSFVAMADPDTTAMEEKITRFSLPPTVHCYTDYKAMLEKEEPDLVAIATPSGEHARIALDCLAAGCHVIIEKPIALSIHDANAIIAAGKRVGRLVCANHQNRFNKSVQYIRRALEQGRFGRLLHGAAHVRWNRQESYYRQASWRGTWAQDGGALMNQCIHNIDLLRWMMGFSPSTTSSAAGTTTISSAGSAETTPVFINTQSIDGTGAASDSRESREVGNDIVEVMAYTDQLIHPYLEAEDLGLALVRFTNGSYGLIEGTTNIYPKNLEETLYIFGSQGTVKAGGTSDNIIEEWCFADGSDDPEEVKRQFSENPPNIYGFGHTPLYSNVIAAIEALEAAQKKEPKTPGTGLAAGQEVLLVDGTEGKKALELVLAIYKSAAEHRPVSLPLDESVSTLDFVGRFDKK